MAKKTIASTNGKNGHVSRSKIKPLSEAAQQRAWRTEVDYFNSIRSRLFRNPKYRGKFVAVRGKEIVGVGDDEFELHHRMSSEYPGQVVLVEQANKEPRRSNVPLEEILG